MSNRRDSHDVRDQRELWPPISVSGMWMGRLNNARKPCKEGGCGLRFSGLPIFSSCFDSSYEKAMRSFPRPSF